MERSTSLTLLWMGSMFLKLVEFNQATHELAKLARVSTVKNFWLGYVQTEIGRSVDDDSVNSPSMNQ